MTIKKYLHSCLCVEESGKRLLFDPGLFSFIEGTITPEDIGPVDVIIYTHKHADHLDLPALKKILAMKRAVIVTHQEIGDALQKEGISHERIEVREKHTVEGFAIESFTAPHGPIPTEIPHNLAYLINGTLLHPGDSLHVEGVDHVDVLALPTFAPWLRAVDAITFAQSLTPKIAIPIHDAFIKDFALERLYPLMYTPKLAETGIDFKPIGVGQEIDTQRL